MPMVKAKNLPSPRPTGPVEFGAPAQSTPQAHSTSERALVRQCVYFRTKQYVPVNASACHLVSACGKHTSENDTR
jgi:hypothetical protein